MSEFDISVSFCFTFEGQIKFENNSKSKYDIMVHYLNEKAEKKTLYLHHKGRKYARDLCNKIIFGDGYIYENIFGPLKYDVPLDCLTIYPIENREYANKSLEEQKNWNSTVIKKLNEKFKDSILDEYFENYHEYYLQITEKTKNEIKTERTGNYWEDRKKSKAQIELNDTSYKGLNKIEKMKKLINEIETLEKLKKKMRIINIKFDFTIESELMNYDSKVGE